MHRMIVQLEPDLWEAFKRACAAKDITASQAVRGFVRSFVEKDDPQRVLPLTKGKGRK